jgi:hypothetical protein
MFKSMMGTFFGLWLFVLSAIVAGAVIYNHQAQYCMKHPELWLGPYKSGECSWL